MRSETRCIAACTGYIKGSQPKTAKVNGVDAEQKGHARSRISTEPMDITRRLVLLGASASLLSSRSQAASSIDSAGREVVIPGRITRVFPAGPPAAILVYTLAPDLLLGWPRANRKEELEFLLPEIGARPEVGRLTGRGNTTNLEILLALKPDIIVDVGSISATYVSLANRVQEQTGIPYVLLNGRFSDIPASYRILGKLIGREEKAEVLARYAEETMRKVLSRIAQIPKSSRPRVYYARGTRGLQTGLGGSINVETIEFLGAINVAGSTNGGLATVSIEQVLVWNPEIIITIDHIFFRGVHTDSSWNTISAVRSNRVHLSPKLPFGWVDFPPAVNRLVGLWWLAKILYPDLFPEDLREITRDFYTRFYHVKLTDQQIDKILAGRD